MSCQQNRPVICWLIQVYDRTAEEQFPPKRKWYRFNYGRATQDEIEDVLHLCQQKNDGISAPAADLKLGDTRVTY